MLKLLHSMSNLLHVKLGDRPTAHNRRARLDELHPSTFMDGDYIELLAPSTGRISVDYFGRDNDVEFLRQHSWQTAPNILAGAFLYKDAIISGAGFLIEKCGTAAIDCQTLPAWAARRIISTYGDPISKIFNPVLMRPHLEDSAAVRRVNRTLISAFHPNFVYGHFLCEMIGRLFLARLMIDLGCRAAIAVPTSSPKWVGQFARLCFTEGELVFFDPKSEVLQSECTIVPTMLNQEHIFSPWYNLATAWFARCALTGSVTSFSECPKPGLKVFLSRANHSGMQGIRNESEVVSMLREKGFTIFEPQLHSIGDQVRFFQNCDLIISDANSSVHNSVFMPFRSSVLLLNYFSHYQTGLSAVRRQRLGLFRPADGRNRTWDLRGTQDAFYEVDVNGLSLFLDEQAW